MSRIQRVPVDPGEVTDATTLNDTYADYSQPSALNEDNTRDGAFDLVHLTNAPIVKNSADALLGTSGMHTEAGTTVGASTTSLGAIVNEPIQNSSGVDTPLMLNGGVGWVLAEGDVLRVWWNLSVKPNFSGSTPFGAYKGIYTLDKVGGGTQQITDGHHCWVVYLEWSTAVGVWAPVSGQTAFSESDGADTGGALSDTPATTVISPWTVFSQGTASLGKPYDAGTDRPHGWFCPMGMWAHEQTGGPLAVYGLRLRVTGILHPAHLSTGTEKNVLIYDVGVGNATQTLEYKGGRLSALQQRGS